MIAPLPDSEIQAFLGSLPDWRYSGEAFSASYRFADFKRAFAAISQIAIECELQGHHPQIDWTYNRVSFSLTTHDAGNRVTERDLKLARAIDRICGAEG